MQRANTTSGRNRPPRADSAAGSPEDDPRSGDRLLLAVIRRAGAWLGPLMVLAILGALAALALPAILGRAVDQVVEASQGDDVAWTTARRSLIATAGLLSIVVAVEALSHLLAGVGTARSTGLLRRQAIRHILAVGPRLSQRTAEGDLVARLGGGTTTTGQAITVVTGLAAALIPPVGGVAALALIDPWLAVTFCLGMISVSGAVRAYLRDARAATAGYLQAQGAIAARLVDALAGARTIAAARTTRREIERVLGPLPSLQRHGVAAWQTMAKMAFQGEPVVLLTQVAVIAVAGLGLAAGRLSPGEMLAASRYAVMAAGIGGVLDELAAWTRARAGAQRLAEVLAEPVTVHGHQILPPGPGTLELRGLTAGPANAPVVRGLDLVIPGGSVVALVGRSGAGKSLTAALAGRLCDPSHGEVRLDGVRLDQLDRPSLRHAVAYAFERPVLMGGTVAEAIALGLDEVSLDDVRRAAGAAHADRFIVRLPNGYSAPLADTPMSGGELQRIGLARAIAQNARVLILDDATSSLDTATEAEIAAALTGAMNRRTRLIVSHRTATAARADLVAWLDGGRIRAVGPHRDLWTDPAYRGVFDPDLASRLASADTEAEAGVAGPSAVVVAASGPASGAVR